MRLSRRRRRGSALVEFGLMWTIMWFMFTGVYQYGYAYYVYNALMTGVANAAELGSQKSYDTSNTAAYTTALQNMVLYGQETVPSGGKPIVKGLTASNVNVNVNMNNSFPVDITVTINNFAIDGFFTTFTLSNKPRATVAYIGTVLCSSC